MYYLGIDLGTSSVKVVAMDQMGTIIGESSSEYPLSYPQVGWAEQDPDDWWKGTVDAIRDLLQEAHIAADQVLSIGFSGQMHGLVALDKDQKALLPAILWCDQRTQKECDELTAHFGSKGLGEQVANQALTGFTAPKILWVKNNHPKIFEQIEHILLPKDYIRYKLTGDFATDYSDASGMILLDVKNKKWSQELCNYIGIKPSALPELYESYNVTGTLTDEALNLLGLQGKVLVVGGAGDQAAGAIGTGAVKSGIISVALGTSGVVFAAHDDFAMDKEMRLHAFCHANGKYHTMGVMLSAASCLKWWTDTVHQDIAFDILMHEAESATPHHQLLFLPYLMGERTPYANPNARGTFIGLTPTTTRGELTRAVIEGVSFGLKDSFDILSELHIPMTEIRVIGGGSKSDFWLQILANIIGLPVSRINTDQGGALGAAILAAVGAGVFNTVESACAAIVKTTETIAPIPEDVIHYQHSHLRYKALYKALEPWF